jgi:hypothetical protein
MNHSIYSVDRVTHLKIVVITLAAAITMAYHRRGQHRQARGDNEFESFPHP